MSQAIIYILENLTTCQPEVGDTPIKCTTWRQHRELMGGTDKPHCPGSIFQAVIKSGIIRPQHVTENSIDCILLQNVQCSLTAINVNTIQSLPVCLSVSIASIFTWTSFPFFMRFPRVRLLPLAGLILKKHLWTNTVSQKYGISTRNSYCGGLAAMWSSTVSHLVKTCVKKYLHHYI